MAQAFGSFRTLSRIQLIYFFAWRHDVAHNAPMMASFYEIAFGSRDSNMLHEDCAQFRIELNRDETEELEKNMLSLKILDETSINLRKRELNTLPED